VTNLHPVAAEAGRSQPARRRSATWFRRHSVFLFLLLAGVVLRVLAQVAYLPGVIYYDSGRYLDNIATLPPNDYAPLGYTALAKAVLWLVSDLAALTVVNHLLALTMAVIIYVALLRRQVRPWIAALAVAPLLLDAYQLFIEQMIMSEALFETLLVLGVVVLTWNARPGYPAAAAAGVCFASAGLTRYAGLPTFLVGAIFLLLAWGTWRRRVANAAVLSLAALSLLTAYSAYNAAVSGEWTVSSHTDARSVYARIATFADCRGISLPQYERVLCRRPDQQQTVNGSLIEGFTFGADSPARDLEPPPGTTRAEALRDFSERIIRHQPVDLARNVGADFVRPFASWQRERATGELPIKRWRFVGYYPLYGTQAQRLVDQWGGHEPAVDRPLALFLRRYQLSVGFVPGPVLAACLLLALSGAAGLTRSARQSGLRSACLLWAMAGAGAFATAVLYQFSWRYFIPVLPLLPGAGALGITALSGRRPATRSPAAATGEAEQG
jgi:hypothetical protein